jgi:hypothetical protein
MRLAQSGVHGVEGLRVAFHTAQFELELHATLLIRWGRVDLGVPIDLVEVCFKTFQLGLKIRYETVS